jgi:hypothetical protein
VDDPYSFDKLYPAAPAAPPARGGAATTSTAGDPYSNEALYPPAPTGKVVGAPGQPFGELRARDPLSWTNWLKEKGQDLFMAGGVEPYRARHMGSGIIDAARSTSPMGAILSAADLPYHMGRGEGGEAAWDVVGAAPFLGSVGLAARSLPQAPMIRPAGTPPPWARVESPGEVAAINAGGRSWVTPSTGELSGRGVPGDPIQGVAQRNYEAVRNSPIALHPSAGPDLSARVSSHIQSPAGGSFNRASAPGVYSTVEDNLAAWQARGGPITASDMDTLRRQLTKLPSEQSAAGRRAAAVVEDYLHTPPRGTIVSGGPQDLAELRANLANARGNYRAGETAETVELGIDRSGTKAGTTYSGMNTGNKTRQQMEALAGRDPVTKEVKLFGATPEELTAVLGASQPGWLESQQRLWGNRLGGGGGLGQFVTTGGIGSAAGGAAHWMGADPYTAGAVSLAAGTTAMKTGQSLVRASNERAVQAAEDAAALIRRNSPEFRARAALSPEVSDPRGMMRDAMAYALMPQAADTGRDWLNQLSVPYVNQQGDADVTSQSSQRQR